MEELSLSSPELLVNARAYASLLGEVPASFSTLLRCLAADAQGNYSPGSEFEAMRVLRSASMFNTIYHALKTIKGDELPPIEKFSQRQLIKHFKPIDLACCIGITYLSRRILTCVGQEIWDDVVSNVQKNADMGLFVGGAMQNIGLGTGLLVGTLPLIAPLLFCKHDPKGFKEYKRHLRANKIEQDLPYEMQRWKATRVHVAAILIQALGLGIEASNAFSQGLIKDTASMSGITDREVYKYKICSVWIETLLSTGTVPNITHRGDFYPLQEQLHQLAGQTDGLMQTGSKYKFLTRAKEDILKAAEGAEATE